MTVSSKCEPCESGLGALNANELAEAKTKLPQWAFAETSIHREWKLKNYAQALAFVTRISVIAEEQNHHPDISFGWGYVKVMLTTHAAKAITKNDVIMAELIEGLSA